MSECEQNTLGAQNAVFHAKLARKLSLFFSFSDLSMTINGLPTYGEITNCLWD